MTTISGPWPFDDTKYFHAPGFIIEDACRLFGITEKTLTGRQKFASVVYARNICIYIIRTATRSSFEEIGRMFNRHHTTIMHSVNWVESRIGDDEAMRGNLLVMSKNVGSARKPPAGSAVAG